MLYSFGYKMHDFIEPILSEGDISSDDFCKWLITKTFCITETDNINCYDISYNCGMNKKLFYAISAINDMNDYKQWFTNGSEFILSRHDSFSKDGFHKASPEELIVYFGGHKSTVCYCGSAMCKVNTLTDYIKIKTALKNAGHNTDNMLCDEDWIDEYLDTKDCFIDFFIDYGGSVKINIVDSKEQCKSRYWCFDDHNMFISLINLKNK